MLCLLRDALLAKMFLHFCSSLELFVNKFIENNESIIGATPAQNGWHPFGLFFHLSARVKWYPQKMKNNIQLTTTFCGKSGTWFVALLDEEFADIGLALPGGEVQRRTLVGVLHALVHRGRALLHRASAEHGEDQLRVLDNGEMSLKPFLAMPLSPVNTVNSWVSIIRMKTTLNSSQNHPVLHLYQFCKV